MQNSVLPVEVSLFQRIVQKLDHQRVSFSVVLFGSNVLILPTAKTIGEIQSSLKTVATEERESGSCLSCSLYEAIRLGMAQFADCDCSKSLVVISEGNDSVGRKEFNETAGRLGEQGVVLNVAIVARHPLYGSKGIQMYGYSLRNLARRTRGKYVELGNQKAVDSAVLKLTRRVLEQEEAISREPREDDTQRSSGSCHCGCNQGAIRAPEGHF